MCRLRIVKPCPECGKPVTLTASTGLGFKVFPSTCCGKKWGIKKTHTIVPFEEIPNGLKVNRDKT
jgi:hypothetical protein